MTGLLRLAFGAVNVGLSVVEFAVAPVADRVWNRLAGTVIPPVDLFDVFEDDAPPMDLRGIPTAACPVCGSGLLKVLAAFDPETYELTFYGLDASCGDCGALLTAPTPLDVPEGLNP